MYNKNNCEWFTLTKTVYHFSSILLFGTVLQPVRVNSDHKRLRNTTREVASRRNPERETNTQNTSSREHVSSVSVFITTSNGNATGKAQETPRKRYSFTSIDEGHTKNPDYSKAKGPRFMYSKKHCKKLEAQGSRAIFFLQF